MIKIRNNFALVCLLAFGLDAFAQDQSSWHRRVENSKNASYSGAEAFCGALPKQQRETCLNASNTNDDIDCPQDFANRNLPIIKAIDLEINKINSTTNENHLLIVFTGESHAIDHFLHTKQTQKNVFYIFPDITKPPTPLFNRSDVQTFCDDFIKYINSQGWNTQGVYELELWLEHLRAQMSFSLNDYYKYRERRYLQSKACVTKRGSTPVDKSTTPDVFIVSDIHSYENTGHIDLLPTVDELVDLFDNDNSIVVHILFEGIPNNLLNENPVNVLNAMNVTTDDLNNYINRYKFTEAILEPSQSLRPSIIVFQRRIQDYIYQGITVKLVGPLLTSPDTK
ncbi:MAG: hypothetical protein KDD48_01565 [Bdellovibrionales bacterium]|nr:hypothetical protein [Bdellovibrionales bacterium]